MALKETEIIFEKFRIIEVLKKDDHSAVYLADHIYLHKKIILKVLNTENLPDESVLVRFKREAKLLAKIKHPNIIDVLDFGTYETYFYISFEYFESRNLRAIIKNNSLTHGNKVSLVIQLFRGLEYAHKDHIVHRDIKPENVLISDAYHLKIGDFGLAMGLHENLVTAQYSIVGTPGYMSPEQIQGLQLTFKSDLFAAGILVYELFTGRNPFLGKDINETINKIMSFDEKEIIASAGDLQPDIIELLTKLLRKNPDTRPDDVYQTAYNLSGADDTTIPKVKTTWRYKSYFKFSAAFIILCFAAAAGYFIFSNPNADQTSEQILSSKPDSALVIQPVQQPGITTTDAADKNKEAIAEKSKTETKPLKEEKLLTPANSSNVPAAEVRKGSLFIECLPWAHVYIDEIKVETTPLKGNISLTEGEHTVVLRHPDYPVFTRRINVQADQLSTIKINLETLFGYLDCKVYPWGEIYVNGTFRGQTPLQGPLRLAPGEYKVLLKNKDYAPAEYSVQILQSQTYELKHIFRNLN